jgi:hypothetical protein
MALAVISDPKIPRCSAEFFNRIRDLSAVRCTCAEFACGRSISDVEGGMPTVTQQHCVRSIWEKQSVGALTWVTKNWP